jgi:hypothetical protein
MGTFKLPFFFLLLWTILTRAAVDLKVLIQSSELWDTLTPEQQYCIATEGLDVTGTIIDDSRCESKDCLCARPQMMSDSLDTCLSWESKTFNVENYNAVMKFMGHECGFNPILKVLDVCLPERALLGPWSAHHCPEGG